MKHQQFQAMVNTRSGQVVPTADPGTALKAQGPGRPQKVEAHGSLPYADPAKVEALAKSLGIPAPVHMGFNLWGLAALVTPEMALDWLTQRNTLNRNYGEGHGAKLGSDLAAGRWWLHHQGIGFRIDGRLQDGQHRLYQIVETGVPALLAVYLNITDDAQAAIDTQRVRKADDVAALRGIDLDRNHIAIVRRAMQGQAKTFLGWSNQEAIEHTSRHIEGAEWVWKSCPRNRAAVRGAILRAWYWEKKDRIAEFCSILVSGTRIDGTVKPEDKAAVYLARWLGQGGDANHGANGKLDGSRDSDNRIYGKTTRALEAFLKGEQIEKFPPTDREVWTMPDL